MRLVRLLFSFVLLTVFGAILLLFLAQNWGMTRVDFFGLQYTIHMAWVLAGAAAFGALLTVVLLLPGHLAAMMHSWSLERELRQWEQDLWKLQARHERLLARQEHMMEAHERVLQSHHRLVGEHSQVSAERDRARAELAAARTSLASALSAASTLPAAHQPTQHPSTPSMPRVAVISPFSPGTSSASIVDSATSKGPAATRPHAHSMPRVVHGGRSGGRVSMPPASRAPRWAARWPAARAAERTAHPAVASPQGQGAADEQAARSAGETAPAREQSVANDPPSLAPVALSTGGRAPTPDDPPDPATAPVLPTVERPSRRAAPQTVPLPLPVPTASAAPATPAAPSAAPEAVAPVAPPSAPQITPPVASPAASAAFSLHPVQDTAGGTGESLAPLLATLRTQLYTDMAAVLGVAVAKRVIVQARLANLIRSVFLSELPLDPSASTSASGDLSTDDEWS